MASAMNTCPLRARRFPIQVPIQYQKSGVPHWYEGKTLNISRTGILFQTDEALQKDATLDIRVEFPASGVLVCQGSVVRSQESAFAVRIHRYNLRRS